MAVNFTTNIALAKPTEAELALNWARSTELAEDNNTIIETVANTSLLSYTPVVTAFTTPPNFGSGSAGLNLGFYQVCQGWVWGNFRMACNGSGISVGSGNYGFSLPLPADGSFHTVGSTLNATEGDCSLIGDGYIYDASADATSGNIGLDVVTVSGVSYARLLTEVHSGKTSRVFKDSMPFVIAADDQFTANFLYKKA